MANEIVDQILFNGGLDSDSDDKFIVNGDYVDAQNIMAFDSGDIGIITNIKGNSEKFNSLLPAGTNKCISSCEYEEQNATVYLNYNSNNNHGIYIYYKKTGTIDAILNEESVLAFSKDSINVQSHVVGDLLYWNEGKDVNGLYINNPRKINIQRALDYTLGASVSDPSIDGYAVVNTETISVIKRSVGGTIYAVLLTDATFSYNFINSAYYQFAFETVYDDKEKSVLSNRTNFIFTKTGGADNYVGIKFYYEYVGDTVVKLNLYYRDSLISGYKLGGVIDVFDPSNVYDVTNNTEINTPLVDGTFYFYRFYGKGRGAAYVGTENKLYDNIPIYANSQLYAGNRLMYGGGRLSYDKEDVSLTFQPYSTPTGSLSGVSISAFDGETYGGNVSSGLKVYGLDESIYNLLDVDNAYIIDVGLTGAVDIVCNLDPIDKVYFTSQLWQFESTLETVNIRQYILDNTDFKYSTDVGGTGNATVEWELYGSDYVLVVYVSTQDAASNPSFSANNYLVNRNDNTYILPGSYYQFCIFLWDKYFRTTGSIYNENTKLYIPERASINTDPSWGIEWNVNERLPNWVRYVSFGYSRSLDFINVWQTQTPIYASVDRSFLIPYGYTYTDGDVLRIFGDNTVYDIESGDDTKVYMDIGFTYTTGDIEILRPKTTEEESVYYELSKLYNYDYQNGWVRGDIGQNNGYFVGGDFNNVGSGSNEVLSHNDSNGNLFYSFRRIIPELDDYGDIEYKNVYFSNKYFDNTNINGLSTFEFASYETVDDKYGSISNLKQVGDTVKVYQKSKITSFYLGKTILQQSDGGEVVVDTSRVLGGGRESSSFYGTIFPVNSLNRYVYGFDIYKGVVWRDSANGVSSISSLALTANGSFNYKMDSYFKDKAAALLKSGINNIKIHIGVDQKKGFIYFTFIDFNTSSNSETIVFNEPTNRWVSKCSFIPEMYTFNDDKMYSFNSGKIYEHDSLSALRCNFYGTQYESYIQFTTHSMPDMIKIFNSLGVHSTSQWTVESIEADANINCPNGFYSKVLDSEFVKEEGVFRAAMPRNMKTRTSRATNYDRLNGDEARSYVVKIKLTNSDITKSELFKVDVNSEASK